MISKAYKMAINLGVLISLLGIGAIVYPTNAGEIATVTLGVFFTIGGLLRLTFAILSPTMGSMFLKLAYASLMVICGIWLMVNPDMGLESLTFAMAIYFLIDGVTEFTYSLALRPLGGGLFMTFSSLIGIALAVLIFMKWPESSENILGLFLGIKLIVNGVALALTGIAIKKTVS